MTAYIYLVRKNKKPVYVGFTTQQINSRWSDHKGCAKRGDTTPLYCAIRKYGIGVFEVECLYESEDIYHTLNIMEHHYIWLYQTHGSKGGYNQTLGGEGALGVVVSLETRNKMSKAHTNRVIDEEWKAKISKSKKNKPRSEETRKKISKAHSRRWETCPITEDIRKKFSDMSKLSVTKRQCSSVDGIHIDADKGKR